MDVDWTFSSCSWLWEDELQLSNQRSGSKWTREEDKAFEDALALYSNDPNMWYKIALAVPTKSLEDLKLHYEALVDDVAAIESDKIPLPCYHDNDNDNDAVPKKKKKEKSSATSVRRGVPWTESEHRLFISGLEKYGRGDWKSISRHCVMTKSNSQVASHAQKYFKRLMNPSNKDGKRSNNTNDMEKMVPNIPVTFSTIVHTGEASTSNWKPPPSPTPFGGTPFVSQAGTAPPGTPECTMTDLPFAIEPMDGVGPTVGMEEISTPDMMDLDEFFLPHFLD